MSIFNGEPAPARAYHSAADADAFFAHYPEAQTMTFLPTRSSVAYFSMEICLEQAIPTYSGGLGVLAGDTLRSAADLGVPEVAVTLLHRKGYFEQHLDAAGAQTEQPVTWQPDEILDLLPVSAIVQIEGRPVRVRAGRYIIRGVSGHEVPVFLLDTAVPENTPWDQTLTDYLYCGASRHRPCHVVLLGMGGAAILRALRYNGELHYHLHEGRLAPPTLFLPGGPLH